MEDKQKLGIFQMDEIYCGDALELMKSIPDGTIHLIISDPPFAINFAAKRGNYNRKTEWVLDGYRDIPRQDYYNFTINWMKECYRILACSGSMYIFSGWTNLRDVLNAIEEIGFKVINHLIWKYQFGVFTKNRYVTSHYHILFVAKDLWKYKFNKIEHYPEDVWIINREYWTGKVKVPTKLPVRLIEKIILFSSDAGDIVLDPFVGSGTVPVVAKKLGRHYLGFEIVEDYYKFAKDRILNTL